MEISSENINRIIELVMNEVLSQSEEHTSSECLSVFSDNVFDPKGVRKYFSGKTCVCAQPDDMPLFFDKLKTLKFTADRTELLEQLNDFKEIVLVTPSLSLLNAIAAGDDSTFIAAIMIRSLLWGKNVTILLDFETPKYLRGTIVGLVAENINALEKMGIKFDTLDRKASLEIQAKNLVSERDVTDAIRDGSMKVKAAPGAIITQLAQDTALEHGVVIEI